MFISSIVGGSTGYNWWVLRYFRWFNRFHLIRGRFLLVLRVLIWPKEVADQSSWSAIFSSRCHLRNLKFSSFVCIFCIAIQVVILIAISIRLRWRACHLQSFRFRSFVIIMSFSWSRNDSSPPSIWREDTLSFWTHLPNRTPEINWTYFYLIAYRYWDAEFRRTLSPQRSDET